MGELALAAPHASYVQLGDSINAPSQHPDRSRCFSVLHPLSSSPANLITLTATYRHLGQLRKSSLVQATYNYSPGHGDHPLSVLTPSFSKASPSSIKTVPSHAAIA
jgi:hypothetical protein